MNQMKLKYDHAFTSDKKHRFFKRLQRLGFLLRPDEVEHPDQHFCRFIAFRENYVELPVYLEFIDARDPKKPIPAAGLSFRSLGQLEKHSKVLRKRGLELKFDHKNYDWKADSKSRLPGWNFVEFKNRGFRGLYPWITEYEKRPGKNSLKNRIKIQNHPNSVKRIVGLELEINRSGHAFFQRLLGKKIGDSIKLPGDQRLYFTHGKSTRLKAIVLEARSLKKVFKYAIDEKAIWRGRAAALIKNPDSMWDLVIVQE